MAYKAKASIETIQEFIGADVDGAWGKQTRRRFAECLRCTQAKLIDLYGDKIPGGIKYGADGFFGKEGKKLFEMAVKDGTLDPKFAAAVLAMHEAGDLSWRNTRKGHTMNDAKLTKGSDGNYAIEGGEDKFRMDKVMPGLEGKTPEADVAKVVSVPSVSQPQPAKQFKTATRLVVDNTGPANWTSATAKAAYKRNDPFGTGKTFASLEESVGDYARELAHTIESEGLGRYTWGRATEHVARYNAEKGHEGHMSQRQIIDRADQFDKTGESMAIALNVDRDPKAIVSFNDPQTFQANFTDMLKIGAAYKTGIDVKHIPPEWDNAFKKQAKKIADEKFGLDNKEPVYTSQLSIRYSAHAIT